MEALTQQLVALQQQDSKVASEDDETTLESNPLAYEQGQRDNRHWELSFKVDIPEFHGGLQVDEFVDWINTVEEILEFKGVPDLRRVSLVTTRLRGRAQAW